MFSAKDFAKVSSKLRATMPDDVEKLIHRQVRKTGVDEKFSTERKHPI